MSNKGEEASSREVSKLKRPSKQKKFSLELTSSERGGDLRSEEVVGGGKDETTGGQGLTMLRCRRLKSEIITIEEGSRGNKSMWNWRIGGGNAKKDREGARYLKNHLSKEGISIACPWTKKVGKLLSVTPPSTRRLNLATKWAGETQMSRASGEEGSRGEKGGVEHRDCQRARNKMLYKNRH